MAKYGQGLEENAGGQVCSCGQHRGSGSSSPHQLAQIYAWFKDHRPNDPDMNAEKWGYLRSYEQRHGRVQDYIYGKLRVNN